MNPYAHGAAGDGWVGGEVRAIETRYAGCRFRSRLEARWAVFFNHMGIRWEYEPEGFHLPRSGPYLPDFLLPDCGTWIEVKGSESKLDTMQLSEAAACLPPRGGNGESGPRLLLLGPIPTPPHEGDLGWLEPSGGRWGFGAYAKNQRPWWLDNGQEFGTVDWLIPTYDPYETSAADAYTAARSARFEHGESG